MATQADFKRRKLRDSVVTMLNQKKDPSFIRYAHWRSGFDLDEIDNELNTFNMIKSGQPSQPVQQYQPQSGQIQQGQIGQTVSNIGGRKIEGGIAQNLGESKAAEEMIASLEKNIFSSLGEKAFSPITGQARAYNPWDTDVQSIQSQINATKQIVGKYLEGGVLRMEDEKKYEKILPKIGDTQEVAQAKVEQVKKLLQEKYSSQMESLAGAGYDISGFQPQSTQPQPTQPQPTVEGAIAWAEDNPENPASKKILEAQKNGTLESIIQKKNQPAQAPQTTPQTPMGQEKIEPQAEVKKESKGTFSSIADKVGNFIGIKKFGQGIGSAIYFSTQEGKELLKKADEGDQASIDAVNEILKDTPNAKEIIGSAALTALNIASAGAVKGLQGTSTAGKIISGANLGGAYGVAGGLEEGKTAGEIVEKGIKGAVLGGAISTAGVGLSKLNKMRKSGQASDIKKAVGQIIQGEKKDIKPALNTLKQIDIKDVKNYSDLKSRIKGNIKELSGGMKELLSSDETLRKLPELSNSVKVGDTVVKTNYIKQSLNDLAELYQKTNNPTELQRIKNLINQSQKSGLSLADINNIAKEYGTEFGKKAFSKLGEPLTGVNSVAYENTRKGVKTTLRTILGDDRARMIDKNISDHLNTLNLVERMEKKSNSLLQKINERGLLEKTGSVVGKSVDLLSGHTLRGFAGGLFPSNVGLKTMNSLDMQNKIQKNLKIINKAEGIIDKIGKAGKSASKASLTTLYNTLRELEE